MDNTVFTRSTVLDVLHAHDGHDLVGCRGGHLPVGSSRRSWDNELTDHSRHLVRRRGIGGKKRIESLHGTIRTKFE